MACQASAWVASTSIPKRVGRAQVSKGMPVGTYTVTSAYCVCHSLFNRSPITFQRLHLYAGTLIFTDTLAIATQLQRVMRCFAAQDTLWNTKCHTAKRYSTA